MNKNDVTKLIMYYEIKKRKEKGFSTAWIARKLGIDYRTVKKYLKMSEDEYSKFLESQTFRSKILDGFEDFVRQSLEDCPEASSAQIFDWLKENFQELPVVNEKTVFNYTLHVRRKHNIPKPFVSREFSKVEELPYGKQAQVDFGEYTMSTDHGKRKKVYFFQWYFPGQDINLFTSMMRLLQLQSLLKLMKWHLTILKASPWR